MVMMQYEVLHRLWRATARLTPCTLLLLLFCAFMRHRRIRSFSHEFKLSPFPHTIKMPEERCGCILLKLSVITEAVDGMSERVR